MDEHIRHALAHDRTVDITTTGRKTGQERRIEIWYYYVDGRVFLAGPPGKRDWYANLLAQPRLTFHLKESVQADLPAQAHPILDPAERRAILGRITEMVDETSQLGAWVSSAPLLEIKFKEPI